MRSVRATFGMIFINTIYDDSREDKTTHTVGLYHLIHEVVQHDPDAARNLDGEVETDPTLEHRNTV